ncbi:acyl carrier protein [Helicobacter anseris]|uniref:Acyl carrier protein n=1 Tax=Helicobacter anseris TaxID=375926 RepID=A0A3D8J8L6_9HELI|nr:acyl carrier protein [Helicobacter anseris]RDU73849.1 acyl carrier protein [Helicobacter anseris]
MKQKVYEILSKILKTKVDDTTSVSMQNSQEWSSIVHIDIIMSLEEEFDILFAENDLASLTSQESIIAKVEELAKAQ